jgi:hypothetical protein
MRVAMTCSTCGATIADRAIVCYKCGTPTAVPAAPERPARRGGAPIAAMVMGVAGVAAAVAWYFSADVFRAGLAVVAVVALVTSAAIFARRR